MLYYYDGYYIFHPTLLRFAPTPTTFFTIGVLHFSPWYLLQQYYVTCFMVKFVVPPTTFCTYTLFVAFSVLFGRMLKDC